MNNTLELSRFARPDAKDRRLKSDEQEFHAWVAQPENVRSLALPKSAARHLLIPPRLYELVEDPDKIDIVFLNPDPPQYVDPNQHIPQDVNCERRIMRAYVLAGTSGHVDNQRYKHDYFPYLVKQGLIKDTDMITHRIDLLTGENPEQLHVGLYEDREDLQRRGVATSFYHGLRKGAQEMGFTIITGTNDDNNITFFTEKLRRIPLGDIKPGMRSNLANHSIRFDPIKIPFYLDLFTVDFLDKKAREEFVEQH